MADEATQETTQAVDTPQAGTETTQSETTDPKEIQARLEREIADRKAANAEAAKHRARVKELEDADAKRKESEMTELEKRDKRNAELEAEKNDALAKVKAANVRSVASELGFADPKDAAKLLDDIPETEEELEVALKGLLKAKPYLAKANGSGIPDTGKGGKPATSADKSADKQRTEEILKSNSFLGRLAQSQKKD